MAENLIPAGITGADLSRLEDCWLVLLSSYPWGEAEADAVGERGAILFGLAARLLGREAAEGEPFGAAWSLAEAARHVSDPQSRAILVKRAKSAIAALPTSHELRPLTMITVRSAYDLFHGDRAGWHRVFAALHFIFLGRMPR